jgi:hypothetical protein
MLHEKTEIEGGKIRERIESRKLRQPIPYPVSETKSSERQCSHLFAAQCHGRPNHRVQSNSARKCWLWCYVTYIIKTPLQGMFGCWAQGFHWQPALPSHRSTVIYSRSNLLDTDLIRLNLSHDPGSRSDSNEFQAFVKRQYLFLGSRNLATGRYFSSTESGIIWLSVSSETASRPNKRLMRTYRWISLFMSSIKSTTN